MRFIQFAKIALTIALFLVSTGLADEVASISIAYEGPPTTNFYNSVMEDGGFFAKNGLTVTPDYSSTSKEAAENAINGGTDFAVVSTFAVADMINSGLNPVILTSVIRYDDMYYIVVNQKAGIITPKDLAGKRIGLVTGDWEYYLEQYMILNDIDKSSITIVPLTTDEIIPALKADEIDAGLVLYHVGTSVVKEEPLKYQMWSVNNHENFYLILICNQKIIADNPAAVKKLIKAFIDSGEWYNANLDQAKQMIESKGGIRSEQAQDMLTGIYPEVSLTQGLLSTLEAQSRYLMKKENSAIAETPNYLSIIDFTFLDSLNPEGDTIIHN